MNIEKIKSYWFAYIYNQQENETDDVDFLRSLIGTESQYILEVACGAGRILAPLAEDGHRVVGFDCDEDMLSFVGERLVGCSAHFYLADAVSDPWGSGYDVVIEAANLLINILSDGEYEYAQKLFISKAARALRSGGKLYLDFNLFADPEKQYSCDTERVVFDGCDDRGVYGVYSILSTDYCPETQMLSSETQTTLTLADGTVHRFKGTTVKHIPNLGQVHSWLDEAGFTIEKEFGDYQGNPISGNTSRCVIVAVKDLRYAGRY